MLLISICRSVWISSKNREVEQCSSILSEMESIIMTYQTDLDNAVDEIQNLQVTNNILIMTNRMNRIVFRYG